MKVLIVDDHAIVRRGVREILAEMSGVGKIGEASSGHAALKAVREGDYDLVILDIALPDGGGMEILKQMRALQPGVRVLMLSMYPEEQYAARALKAGASGYLTKDSAADELTVAVQQIAQGKKYITRALAEKMATRASGEPRAPHETLSDRELQVLRPLAAGKTASKIAQELALSAKTISTYRTRILEKLELKTTAEIIRYALEHGLT